MGGGDAAAVVGEENDEGVFEKFLFAEVVQNLADVLIHAPLHGGVGLPAFSFEVGKAGEVFRLGLHGGVRGVVGEEAEEGLFARSHPGDCFVREPIGEIRVLDLFDGLFVSEEVVFFGSGEVAVAAGMHAEEVIEALCVWQHAGNGVADMPLANERSPVTGFFEMGGNGGLIDRDAEAPGEGGEALVQVVLEAEALGRAFGWLGYSWMGAAVLMSFTDFSRCSR